MLDEKLKRNLNCLLSSINSQLKIFINKYKDNYNLKLDIENLIYSHPIYLNFQHIINFKNLINYYDIENLEKIQKRKQESEMYKIREKEFNKIQDFVQENYKESSLNININEEEKKTKDNNTFLNKKIKNVTFEKCYICKKIFKIDEIHKFYTNLCKKCGDYNYSFREMTFDWEDRIAIITGGRVKIGFNIAIKLLSYNCKVLITTRFPKDALLRYQSHPNYDLWKKNLFIYPIDFRFIDSTVKFIQFIEKTFPYVDFLINNAAQTIRRNTDYYKYLLSIENKTLNDEDTIIIKNSYQTLSLKNNLENLITDESLVKISSNNINQEIFPLSVIASQFKIIEEKYQPIKTIIGFDGQPYDFSKEKNSWQLEIDEIPFQEFLEVQIINTWTPYYLCVKLKPLLEKSPFKDKYIVNVSSIEGIFNSIRRSSFHPHTNMAKAALNMMTKTCGSYYKKSKIYMTSVDTGWVSPMNNAGVVFKKKDNFENEIKNLPLDEIDGAMRVLFPIIEGIVNKKYLYGILLKNYTQVNW